MIIEEPKENKEALVNQATTNLIANEELVRMSNLMDDIHFLEPTSTVPTNTPFRSLDRIKLYKNGTTKTLYVWDSSTQTWLSSSLDSSSSVAGMMTNSAGESISNITDQKLTWNTAAIESGVTCDLTNDRFEILTAGIYFLNGQISFESPVSGKIIQAIIEDNTGSYYAQSQVSTSSNSMHTVNVSHMGNFSAGDKIQLHAYHNCGVSEFVQGTINTFFQIMKV